MMAQVRLVVGGPVSQIHTVVTSLVPQIYNWNGYIVLVRSSQPGSEMG